MSSSNAKETPKPVLVLLIIQVSLQKDAHRPVETKENNNMHAKALRI